MRNLVVTVVVVKGTFHRNRHEQKGVIAVFDARFHGTRMHTPNYDNSVFSSFLSDSLRKASVTNLWKPSSPPVDACLFYPIRSIVLLPINVPGNKSPS